MASRKPPELNRENLILAIEQHFGNIHSIAQHFGKTRQTIYNHIGDDAELKRLLEEARDVFIEFAEGALVERIRNYDTTAIIFALKTRGKNRGYAERTEHTGADGGAIKTENKTISLLSKLSEQELDDIIAGNPPSKSREGTEIDTE